MGKIIPTCTTSYSSNLVLRLEPPFPQNINLKTVCIWWFLSVWNRWTSIPSWFNLRMRVFKWYCCSNDIKKDIKLIGPNGNSYLCSKSNLELRYMAMLLSFKLCLVKQAKKMHKNSTPRCFKPFFFFFHWQTPLDTSFVKFLAKYPFG